jgi:hypothetical protein
MKQTLFDIAFSTRAFSSDILTWLLKDEKHQTHYLDDEIIERSQKIKNALAKTLTFENQHPKDVQFLFGFSTFLGSITLRDVEQIYRLLVQYETWNDFRYAPLESFFFEGLSALEQEEFLYLMQYLSNRCKALKGAKPNHLIIKQMKKSKYEEYIIPTNTDAYTYFTTLEMTDSLIRRGDFILCSAVQGGVITKEAVIAATVVKEQLDEIEGHLESIESKEIHSHEQHLISEIVKDSI